MTKKKTVEKQPLISWGAGAIGQLDDDKHVDVKAEHVTFHPRLGPLKFPDIKIENVDINLPLEPVQDAVSFIGKAMLSQMDNVKKVPFVGDMLKSFSSK